MNKKNVNIRESNKEFTRGQIKKIVLKLPHHQEV